MCSSAVCDAVDNACGYASGDGTCTQANAATVCRSGLCSVTGVCQAPGVCLADGDCPSTQFCNTQTFVCAAKVVNGGAIPTLANHDPALTGACTTPVGTAVCVSTVCDTTDNDCGYANGDGTCTAATASTVCRSGACSASGVCIAGGSCLVDADCTGGDWCDESTATCTSPLANGAPIPSDPAHTSPTLNGSCTTAAAALVCKSGVCDTGDGECGYAPGDGPCTAANGATVCQSGVCSVSGVCEASGTCLVDADCTSAQWCNETTKACVARLGNGVAVPSDAAHVSPTLNGSCTAAAGAAVCQSAVCDAKNNECGYAAGDGPCTAATGSTVCQSGVCSVSGVCEAAGGCLVNADCTAGAATVCDTTSFTCVVPADGGVDAGADASTPTYSVQGDGCTVSSPRGEGSSNGAAWTLLALAGLVTRDRARRRRTHR